VVRLTALRRTRSGGEALSFGLPHGNRKTNKDFRLATD
jgi:hypothetical protein